MAQDQPLAISPAAALNQTAGTWIERTLGLAVLLVLAVFTHALFYQLPYIGFYWNSADNRIEELFVSNGLEIGDQLLQVGEVSIADYQAHSRLPLFPTGGSEAVVPLVIRRGDQTLAISWTLPGRNAAEVWNRFSNQWWLAYVFWAFGQIALLGLRPKDARWRLFIAFNFLTALWLSASSISQSHRLNSAVWLRSTLWMCIPIYWHFHWVVPKALGRLPPNLVYGGYTAALALAFAEPFELLPANAYALGFVAALLGSVLIMVVHFALRSAERRDILVLAAAIFLAFGLPLLLGIFVVSGAAYSGLLISLFALPLLPLAYLWAAYRGQLAGLQVRTNRLIALYLFSLLLGVALMVAVPLADQGLDFPGDSQAIAILSALVVGVSVAVGLAPFQRFIERHVLRIPLPPADLLETYAARITVSLNEQRLASLLRDEILPSLLIRQSALIRLNAGVAARVAYLHGLEARDMPSPSETERLLATAGQFRPVADSLTCPWVRLALRLTAENKLLGIWLLGRRDPDDLYGAQDFAVLKSLANQTAIALTNIVQAESLRALYQEDIEKTENQRTHLARELHDNLLNELARLETIVDERAASPEYLALCESLIATVRQTISDLRPDALNYGLYHALQSLADNLAERQAGGPLVAFRVVKSAERYPASVELHVYRIVQQACDNALKHAAPRAVSVGGELRANQIDLRVEDDGSGFTVGENAEVARLAAHKHFGLAGMFERAAIIGAEVHLDSAPGQGTRIQICWPSRPP